MNPPVRDATHKTALWHGLTQGIVDVLGSDHAPHARDEKARPYPASPSGMSCRKALVAAPGRSHERGPGPPVRHRKKGRPAVGYDADVTVVDIMRRETITNRWIASRAGWTPYDGVAVTGWPVSTLARGARVMWEGELTTPAIAEAARFLESLASV
jgi:dihydroorotase